MFEDVFPDHIPVLKTFHPTSLLLLAHYHRLIQQKIDAGRHQQAIDVITSDENIVQFQQLFSAEIDENSIQAL